MATDGQIIEITDRQSLDPDVCLNVYHYRIASGLLTISAATIAEFWWNDCNEVIRELQCDSLLHMRVTARNLDNLADYGEYIVPVEEREGTQGTGQALSRESAVSVTFRPETIEVRPGGKRIGGLGEAISGQWGFLEPTYLELVEDYAAHMSSQLNSITPAFVLTPVIVGLPNDDRPSRVEVDITGYVINPYISTQNTRKVGRGA